MNVKDQQMTDSTTFTDTCNATITTSSTENSMSATIAEFCVSQNETIASTVPNSSDNFVCMPAANPITAQKNTNNLMKKMKQKSDSKRRTLLLKDKYDIINKIESGVKRSEIISEYKLKTQFHLTEIMKKKALIIEKFEKQNPKLSKTTTYLSSAKHPDVEEALVIWMKQMRDKKISLSSEVFGKKGEKLAKDMGIMDFKASNRYIIGLKKRQNINWITERGESDSVNPEIIQKWESKLTGLLSGYKPENVYNLDETAFFYRLLPNQTYAFGNESRFGTKKLKERITLLLITNANGSDRKLIMIGKSKNPRAFRGIKTLPIEYYSQTNSWMDSIIFAKIMRKFNEKMKKLNKNIILFMDNCSSHKQNFDLSHIDVHYFPANCTSVVQVLNEKNYFLFKKLLISFCSAPGSGNN
jgi:hypothetical protein